MCVLVWVWHNTNKHPHESRSSSNQKSAESSLWSSNASAPILLPPPQDRRRWTKGCSQSCHGCGSEWITLGLIELLKLQFNEFNAKYIRDSVILYSYLFLLQTPSSNHFHPIWLSTESKNSQLVKHRKFRRRGHSSLNSASLGPQECPKMARSTSKHGWKNRPVELPCKPG